MIGRAAPTNMWVMSIQYDFSERMVLLTADATYIQRRKKIKSKLASLKKNQNNKEIVAQGRLSQQENCVAPPSLLSAIGAARTDCTHDLDRTDNIEHEQATDLSQV
jgi:hypothetical protein